MRFRFDFFNVNKERQFNDKECALENGNNLDEKKSNYINPQCIIKSLLFYEKTDDDKEARDNVHGDSEIEKTVLRIGRLITIFI